MDIITLVDNTLTVENREVETVEIGYIAGSPGIQGPPGPQGATGPQGVEGVRGLTGADGADGAPGAKGDDGTAGATGATGPPGIQGLKGDRGDPGPTGLTGATGPQGLTGPQGPTGSQGVPGLKGDIGDTGATGATGPPGIQGLKGDRGDPGPTGLTGATGPQGLTGPQGDVGPQGVPGLKGDQGATGATGATGSPGIQGLKGDRGDPGPTGLTGATGAQGLAGPQGLTGPQGSIGLKGDKGDTGTIGSIGPQGPKGDQGATGAKGDTGLTGATGATGAQGDIGLTGATGPQGLTGPQGPIGPDGPIGLKGDKGDQGDIGFTGPQGIQGQVGDTGPQGLQGVQGDPGPTGATGPKGDTGDTGPVGAQGIQGVPGADGAAGPTGPVGATGATGPTGPSGVANATAPATYNSGTQTVGVAVGNSAGTVAAGNDARLSDARTPLAHAASHALGGTDPVTAAAIGASASTHTHTALPNSVTMFGHSYLNSPLNTYDRTGRIDNQLRGVLNLTPAAFRNRAVAASRLTLEGRSTAGWTRIYQEAAHYPNRGSGPYVPASGAAVFCWGINDIGVNNADAQVRAAFKNTLRAAISRWRAAATFENDSPTVVYTGSWANDGFWYQYVASGANVHTATTVGPGFTITLPSDYKGEPVVLSFIGKAGVSGGTVTFSGTAGITGTLSTSNAIPAATGTRVPTIRRITTLTAVNAGQTIVATVSQMDASGEVNFDCWWLESKTPAPVIVCDIARLTATGYAGYAGWTGTEAQKDQNVVDWNADITTLVTEFDGMVQIAGMDAALGKNASLYSDGLHPNEVGASKVVEAIRAAMLKLTPTAGTSPNLNINPPSVVPSAITRPRRAGHWYTADARGTGTAYTAVAGDMFALPFWVAGGRERFNGIGLEALASVTGTTIRWGIFDDIDASGFPQAQVMEPTSGGVFTVTTGTGAKASPSSGTGSLSWLPNPGLYWLVVKFVAVGAGHTFRTLTGPSLFMPTLNITGLADIAPVGWKLTGQDANAFPATYPAFASISDNVPMVGVLAG